MYRRIWGMAMFLMVLICWPLACLVERVQEWLGLDDEEKP